MSCLSLLMWYNFFAKFTKSSTTALLAVFNKSTVWHFLCHNIVITLLLPFQRLDGKIYNLISVGEIGEHSAERSRVLNYLVTRICYRQVCCIPSDIRVASWVNKYHKKAFCIQKLQTLSANFAPLLNAT